MNQPLTHEVVTLDPREMRRGQVDGDVRPMRLGWRIPVILLLPLALLVVLLIAGWSVLVWLAGTPQDAFRYDLF